VRGYFLAFALRKLPSEKVGNIAGAGA
jgi:hypothetical protein